MGMKLKSGADLCGFQLTNFCVQGEASAPSDAALGRKYFHTNATDDVATGISLLNRERIYLGEGAWRATAYLDDIAGIQTKLDMILGDVDLDGVIENMNEVIKFLEDNKDTENLMTLLNNKLDKSGGTIEGDMGALKIKRNLANMSAISFENTNGLMGYLGFYRADQPALRMSDNTTTHILIHSGNIGSYAMKRVDQVGDLNSVSAGEFFFSKYQAANRPSTNFSGGLTLQVLKNSTEDQRIQLAFGTDYVGYVRGYANGTYTAWKTIAFTDSTVAAAQKLVTSAGNAYVSFVDSDNESYAYAKINGVGIGFNGNTIEAIGTNGPLYIQRNVTKNTIINQYGGNVLIGTTTDSGYKLDVNGDIASRTHYASRKDSVGENNSDYFRYGRFDENGGLKLQFGTEEANAYFAIIDKKWTRDLFAVSAQGDATIGGDLRIKGNLIVEKEISAGGAGAEGGTSGSGSAEGVSEIFTPTSTSMVFNHNLGEDVIVQVYEKSGNVWNMVIVDTEITSATKVTLRFGKTETTQHKVVIMGV